MKTQLVATILLAAFHGQVVAQSTDIAVACQSEISRLGPKWRLASVSKEVRDAAKKSGEDPRVAYGDFDEDTRQDVALLVESGAFQKKIVFCLSSTPGQSLVVNDPACTDGIIRMAKGERYYDLKTDTNSWYPRDGVHAYCFEKAGATYLLENGTFKQIVDSD